ncbi:MULTISPECIES: type II toxin-antitoxin system HicA family toxin [Enterobacteriaceae]|jgi:predicted RNA binding protein YcfA (HicA-like mRNA interferase family)|uniref:type II toxin-antitoxin system HicA family toxin n=1 Tax=Enterobacteriaceae TaxID=543 RepID=UPI0009080B15|nr:MULTISPECIES: type II toxin-antitoxin system HicA family toxin [Enterobacteriaceae]ELH8609740.1 type II toxin-antitoxin system HicA family toxin [Enterobacter asburiae]MBT1945700.1 type II toxin-antitoxin system HicA family toxin [Enterobacter hormaechei subsp. xiangfangensis]HAV1831930.1 type II toxin-antitoxin system HicA family toxin [Enterobacter hormaechei subsp. steigerwaltii]HBI6864194.1 type II toxin-antitoxin system HicA family toxin [Enterobacter pasteurii]EIY5154322.1 type II tox
MGTGLYPKLTELLSAAGCYFERQGKGSHEIWFSPISNRNFSVPYTIVSRHTANGILKQAGLPKNF